MPTDTQTQPVSKAMLWAGYIVSALPVLMFLLGASMGFSKSPDVVKGMAAIGWPEYLAIPIAIVQVACAVVYVIPQTAVLGAILLTGYLGGATAAHVRVGEPFYLPIVFGVLVWLGLYLRDPRVRALIPLRW